jgi:hypothetical protein
MKLIRKIIGVVLLLCSGFFAVDTLVAANLIGSGTVLTGLTQLVISVILTAGFYSIAKKVYPGSLRIF